MKKAIKKIIKNPTFFTVLGIGSMGMSCIVACKSVPKYKLVIDDIKIDKGVITTKDIITTGTKTYLPAIILFVAGAACVLNANWIYKSNLASVAAALSVTETRLHDTTKKIAEKFGDNAVDDVEVARRQQKIEDNPPTEDKIYSTKDSGDQLCFDLLSGRYFYSTINKIDKAVNRINDMCMRDSVGGDFVTLNDFYDELGLPHIELGDRMGWNYSFDGMIDVRHIPRLNEDGVPIITLDFLVKPEYHDVKYY